MIWSYIVWGIWVNLHSGASGVCFVFWSKSDLAGVAMTSHVAWEWMELGSRGMFSYPTFFFLDFVQLFEQVISRTNFKE